MATVFIFVEVSRWALEDPASKPTGKAQTSWPGAEDTLPWSPRSLLGGASDGTTLAGSGVEDLFFPARLRWYPSMLDCTSLLGGAAAIHHDRQGRP
jgi:hypothetical protein